MPFHKGDRCNEKVVCAPPFRALITVQSCCRLSLSVAIARPTILRYCSKPPSYILKEVMTRRRTHGEHPSNFQCTEESLH